MKNILISMISAALLIGFGTWAENGKDAQKKIVDELKEKQRIAEIKPRLNYIANEFVTTEQTYHRQLKNLVQNMEQHRVVLQEEKNKIKKYPWNLSEIRELDDFLSEMSKTSTNLKNIISNGEILLSYFTALSTGTEELAFKDLLTAFKDIDQFFLNDTWYVNPHKTHINKFAKFQEKYSKLYDKYLKTEDETFYNSIAQYLSAPLQRGPRYSLLMTEIGKYFSELASLMPKEIVVKQLADYIEIVLKSITQKTKAASSESHKK